jgi:hypothetical protein
MAARMQIYLEAHDQFVAWLEQAAGPLTAAEIDERLRTLALCAAQRGMTAIHWTFVVDGLVAYVNRRWPDNALLPGYVARGFDLSAQWDNVRQVAAQSTVDACSEFATSDENA